MVNIFVDARSLQDPNYAFRGIGRHGSHLVRTLKERGGADINLVALTSSSLPGMSEVHKTLFGDVVTRIPIRFAPGDCFFQPSPMTHESAFVDRLLVRDEIFKSGIIHDFIPYDVPGYLTDEDSSAFYQRQLGSLARLDAYFPNSRYSGRRLREICGMDEGRIQVTGIAVDDVFFSGGGQQPEDAAILGRVGVNPYHYYFFVGGGDRRKNAPLAINATADCNRLLGRDIPLVVCGSYEPNMVAELSRMRPGHKIVFLSNLGDAQVACLYRNSLLTVSPSFIEGFSIPVVEAIAAGSPVFLSDCDAHLELVDTANTVFSAHDPAGAAEKMAAFIVRPELRADLIRKQSGAIARYRSGAVGEMFWRGFAEAYQRHRNAQAPAKAAIRRGDGRPRIAFVTPWPPERSGVADYTRVTCRALSKLCQLDVFTAAPGAKAGDFPEGRLLGLDSPELDERNYDHIVHVIGNSDFHQPMHDRLVSHGGAAVIHDARLLEYYDYHLPVQQMLTLTERFVGRPVSRTEIDGWLRRPAKMESLYLDDVLDSADPVIVHHREFADEIRKRYEVPVHYVPFAITKDIEIDIFTDTQKVRARGRIGVAPDRLLVVSFGFVAPVKGSTECVQALKHLVDWGYEVDFWFVGHADAPERKRLCDLADSLGIRANLFFSDGYISDEVYTNFLLGADFAVQLRKVGMGQGSGTVADCASVGLTCVSNRNVADSVEAPSYNLRIPDVISPLLIAEKIADGAESGMHRQRHDSEREAYRRTHSPEAYAEAFIKAVAKGGAS